MPSVRARCASLTTGMTRTRHTDEEHREQGERHDDEHRPHRPQQEPQIPIHAATLTTAAGARPTGGTAHHRGDLPMVGRGWGTIRWGSQTAVSVPWGRGGGGESMVEFHVMPDDIRTHGGQVQGYRQRVDDAASAARDHARPPGLRAPQRVDGADRRPHRRRHPGRHHRPGGGPRRDRGDPAHDGPHHARPPTATPQASSAGRPGERRPRRRPQRPFLALRHRPARLHGLLLRGAGQRVVGGRAPSPASRSGSTSTRPSSTRSAACSPPGSAGSSTTSSRSRAGSTTSRATPRRSPRSPGRGRTSRRTSTTCAPTTSRRRTVGSTR